MLDGQLVSGTLAIRSASAKSVVRLIRDASHFREIS